MFNNYKIGGCVLRVKLNSYSKIHENGKSPSNDANSQTRVSNIKSTSNDKHESGDEGWEAINIPSNRSTRPQDKVSTESKMKESPSFTLSERSFKSDSKLRSN